MESSGKSVRFAAERRGGEAAARGETLMSVSHPLSDAALIVARLPEAARRSVGRQGLPDFRKMPP
jgi:hypothetical protein